VKEHTRKQLQWSSASEKNADMLEIARTVAVTLALLSYIRASYKILSRCQS